MSGDCVVARHHHGDRLWHTHAWADFPHDHLLRELCHRPECEDCETHNIHPSPQDNDG